MDPKITSHLLKSPQPMDQKGLVAVDLGLLYSRTWGLVGMEQEIAYSSFFDTNY